VTCRDAGFASEFLAANLVGVEKRWNSEPSRARVKFRADRIVSERSELKITAVCRRMYVRLTGHRSTHEIDGNCIEITDDSSSNFNIERTLALGVDCCVQFLAQTIARLTECL
jgi:hypothetical protein